MKIISADEMKGNPWRSLSDHIPLFAEVAV
jgi:endonuclease/exonuclease/phosphatase family metal-dependent hydrolase